MATIRSFALLVITGGILAGCAAVKDVMAPPSTPPLTAAQREREERIVRTPWFVSSEYFREKRGEEQPVLDFPLWRRSREDQEAKQQAIEERVTKLEVNKPTGEASPSLGYVVKVSERSVYTDLTAKEGVGIGTVLMILREGGEELKHPVTGQSLGQAPEEIGTVRVVDLRAAFSIAEIVELKPGEEVRVKDRVRTSTRP